MVQYASITSDYRAIESQTLSTRLMFTIDELNLTHSFKFLT